MNRLLCEDWTDEPPNIKFISQTMPSSPCLSLNGSGHARMSLDNFIRDLNRDVEKQQGHYFVRVLGHGRSNDEADIYTLQTWQICLPEDGTYEAVILLYYAPINQYLTLKKHFGQEDAQKYLDKIAARNAVVNALAEVLD
ncbi:hypothetical protein [Fortiea contorta]|uniref:hypothetical protein n=1 Tax=Fortiea contorta TaxID=1892405 RepID=UPI00037EA893|nr:hypothetical protein [Fortiea contorta]